ncbi:MAG: alcohol dehydrogenase catalytic domain-containing protein [Paracoccus sp. (in: a-proteobacteria)]|uniref:alcohol dehydrogenase catalytic domain-containing protein n=1 Tax=Paracoccus sp. TaxID=267 RepID=UPI0030021217
MKALVYTGVETLDYADAPRPRPGEGEDLIRIHASGICGSDMHAYLGHDDRRPAPLVLGHEAAGIVLGGPDDGRRVTINPLVTCQTCEDCQAGRTNLCPRRQIISMPPRPGAFADYVAMPRRNLVTVPDDVPLEKAALAEPLACGWHAVRLAGRALDRPLDDLRTLVIGGGAIGTGAALALRAQGAANVTLIEPGELRRARLAGLKGVTVIASAADRPDLTGACHLVIDGVGFEATRATACAAARPGGQIVHIGLGADRGGLDIRRMTLQEIGFTGTYTYTELDFRDTAEAIFSGALGPLDWFDRRPLSDGPQAFADIRAGRAAAPKILLIPDQEDRTA